MRPNPIVRRALVLATLWTVFAIPAVAAGGAESRTQKARGGAGLRAGQWTVRDLTTPSGGEDTETLAFEGYFQKGLDLHLAVENTIGFWQRSQSWTETGGPFDIEFDTDVYLVPTLTTLKAYPFTRPTSPIEPYLSAGVGVVMGIERGKATSSDPLSSPDESTSLRTGLGTEVGGGLEMLLGGSFGLTFGAGYRWASFGEDVGGRRMYRGSVLEAGLTYRYRYQ